MDVKGRLRQLMDERGWSVYRLAREADIPWSTLHNMFVRNTDPSVKTLESLCSGMGITLSQFFDTEHNGGLSAEQTQLLQQWSGLNRHDRQIILELIHSLNTKNESAGNEPK